MSMSSNENHIFMLRLEAFYSNTSKTTNAVEKEPAHLFEKLLSSSVFWLDIVRVLQQSRKTPIKLFGGREFRVKTSQLWRDSPTSPKMQP